MPIVRRLINEVHGIAPFPITVVTTGIWSCSASCVNSDDAPFRMTPFPARMIGRTASSIRRAARSTLARAGVGALTGSRGSGLWFGPASSSATFSGSSTCVAPGFSASESLNAFRRISGTTSGLSTRAFHFVIRLNSWRMSTYWCDSRWIFERFAWAVIATSGARSRKASATPVTRLVAPGPSVARHTPAWPERRPETSAMNAAAPSWRVRTNRTELPRSASMSSRFSSPGMPNAKRTPSLSRQETRSRAAFMPLHRSLGGSFHPARSRVRSVHVFGGDRDGGEDEPVSGGPANRDRRHVLQESSRSRFDRDVVDHPGALQHVRHRAAIVTDSEEPGGGPRELDVRALQTGRRIRPSERADDGLLNRSIGTFLCVTRRLDLDRGRRRFRVPRQADDDRQPARTLAFQHLHIVRNFLVCREDRDRSRGQRLPPAGVVHVVDLPVHQVDDDLLGLVGMAPELGARGRHRLGEPFERQPGSLLSTREQKARGLVRCIDFPVGDRQASGFLRAWHGSVSGTREATPSNIVRGTRKRSYRLATAFGGDPKPGLESAIRNSKAFRKSIPRALHSSASRDTNGAIVSRSPIRARSTARSDPSRRFAIASATPHRASRARVNIFLTPASANTSAIRPGVQPPLGG